MLSLSVDFETTDEVFVWRWRGTTDLEELEDKRVIARTRDAFRDAVADTNTPTLIDLRGFSIAGPPSTGTDREKIKKFVHRLVVRHSVTRVLTRALDAGLRAALLVSPPEDTETDTQHVGETLLTRKADQIVDVFHDEGDARRFLASDGPRAYDRWLAARAEAAAEESAKEPDEIPLYRVNRPTPEDEEPSVEFSFRRRKSDDEEGDREV